MVKVYFAGDFPQKNGMELDVLNVCGKKLPTKEWNGTRCVECVEKNFQQKNGMELDVLNVWKKLT